MGTETNTARAQRKASGVFYTPKHIVDYVVRATLEARFCHLSLEQASHFRIIDPSCGSGCFLLGVYDYLLDWHLVQYLRAGEETRRHTLKKFSSGWKLSLPERRRILQSSIFGVDIDPLAVNAAREALAARMVKNYEYEPESAGQTYALLNQNIICGNAIIPGRNGFNCDKYFMSALDAGGFDAVIGNPPYGATLSAAEKKYLLKHYDCGSSDTAAAFIERGIELLAPAGRLGFVIPKAFSYASNWERLRERHLSRLVSVTDLGKSWDEVKLEQCAIILGKTEQPAIYKCVVRRGHLFLVLGPLEKSVAAEFGFILQGVSAEEVALARRLKKLCASLSARRNQRGAALQKLVRKTGDMFAIGGRQIQRWQVNPAPARRINTKKISDPKAKAARNSVLVQNIVAHIENPVDHIKITAAVCGSGTSKLRLLDTVNQIKCASLQDARVICGILNSRLMNWYAYRFVFGKAVRTMHFDAPATGRLPIPDFSGRNAELAKSITDVVAQLESSDEKAPLEEALNLLVYDLYGLSADERALIDHAMP